MFAAEPAPGPTPGNVVVTFLSPAVSVTITKLGQRVLVNATRAFGSTLATGANGLSLYICWAGVSIAAPNAPVMDGLSVGPNQRIPFSLSAVVPNLPPGTYLVGLCGFALTPSAWNNNGVGYTTAIVF